MRRLRRGIVHQSAAYAVRLSRPVLLGFDSNVGGNPSVPAHSAGYLLVSVGANNNTHGGIAPSLPSPWVLGDDVVGGTNRSAAVYYMIAPASGQTANWSNASGARTVWVFSNAAIDLMTAFEAAGSTTLDWPQLAGMASGCIVGAYVMSRNAQTDVTAVAISGFTTRVARNSIPAAWVGDTNTDLISSFNPANGTFDTSSSGHAGAVFSVKST